MTGRFALAGACLFLAAASAACRRPPASPTWAGETASFQPTARQEAFLDTLAERTFRYFWELSDPQTGLTPDRSPTPSFASVAAVGFALTAYPIGVERGFVSRLAAAERTRNTLRFFWNAPQGAEPSGRTGHHGFFYHFLDPKTGVRFETVELSTIDTALFLAGALFCQSYFDADQPVEAEVRALAESLYARVDWQWAQVRPPTIALGWNPEHGHLPYDWRGYNESMILTILALGSPTHAVSPGAWIAWMEGCRWGTFQGQEHIGFAPLFGHQYSHVWIDLGGIQDSTIRAHGIDWFENSRRATLAQRRYAMENPSDFAGYGEYLWGLTACDGPVDATLSVHGRERVFRTYAGRGASFTGIEDDGTICPSAAGGSIPFAPEFAIPTLLSMRMTFGDRLFGEYGFLDALNPTLDVSTPTQHGSVSPGVGWFDTDYLGIDEGPILAMLENYQSGLVWRTMRHNPHLLRGLRRAGFSGGWLDAKEVGR